jgi:predicted nucleic acid-binding protein
MGLIFDSCIWIGLAANEINPQTLIDMGGDLPVFTSVISIGELSFGVHSCIDPAERSLRAAYLRQVESRPILNISANTGVRWAFSTPAI